MSAPDATAPNALETGEPAPGELDPSELAALVEDPTVLELRDDAPAIVAGLAVQTFALVVRRLEAENRLDLVIPHATAEQLTGVLDLCAWKGDRVNSMEARGWLLAIADLRTGIDAVRGALIDTIYDMDPEMWVLALAPLTAVGEIDVEDDASSGMLQDHMAALHTWESPDGFYIVGVPDDEFGRAALRILTHIYNDNLEEGRKILMRVKYGLHSESEEMLFRWRSGRLADLGFPTLEDAMRLFAPASRDEVMPQELAELENMPPPPSASTEELPILWRAGGELLRGVMARFESGAHGERSREFLLLVNELMIAQRMEPGDVEGQARAIHQAQATLGLGLELLRGVEEDADALPRLVMAVERAGVRKLFRYAYGPLRKLRAATLALHRDGRISVDKLGSLLDRPWGATLRSLGKLYPELPIGNSEQKRRPLASRSDLALATRRVAEVHALVRMCFDPEGYGVDPVWVTRVDEPEKLRLGDLLRAGLIQKLVPAGPERFTPVTGEDLAWAKAHLLNAKGELVPRVREDFDRRAAALGVADQAAALAEIVLPRLSVELSGLELDHEGRVDMTRRRRDHRSRRGCVGEDARGIVGAA